MHLEDTLLQFGFLFVSFTTVTDIDDDDDDDDGDTSDCLSVVSPIIPIVLPESHVEEEDTVGHRQSLPDRG